MFSDQEALHKDPYMTNSADSALTTDGSLVDWVKMRNIYFIKINELTCVCPLNIF